MAHLGELIDKSYDPSKDYVYSIFLEYFGNLDMTKIKDVNDYSMYAAKIHCLLSTENRYLFIFTEKDENKQDTSIPFSYFRWLILETRSLQDQHNIPPQNYKPRRLKSLMTPINMVSRNDKYYTYKAENLPLQVTLLAKKPKELEYQPKGNIVAALETYNTIISFLT